MLQELVSILLWISRLLLRLGNTGGSQDDDRREPFEESKQKRDTTLPNSLNFSAKRKDTLWSR